MRYAPAPPKPISGSGASPDQGRRPVGSGFVQALAAKCTGHGSLRLCSAETAVLHRDHPRTTRDTTRPRQVDFAAQVPVLARCPPPPGAFRYATHLSLVRKRSATPCAWSRTVETGVALFIPNAWAEVCPDPADGSSIVRVCGSRPPKLSSRLAQTAGVFRRLSLSISDLRQ